MRCPAAAWPIILALASWASDLHAAAPVRVTMTTEDGVQIVGAYYQPSRRPTPAVILLHMLTRSHEDWDALATRLADSGIAAFAIDFRGHGASGGDGMHETDPDATRLVLDVKAARAYLRARSDVLSEIVGIAGASVGANAAVIAAAADPTIRSLALLSAGLDYRGLRIEAPMRKYGDRPALIVASLEDPYAVRSARRLATFGAGLRDVQLLSNAGHGTVMLARDWDLARVLVDWFQRTLLQ